MSGAASSGLDMARGNAFRELDRGTEVWRFRFLGKRWAPAGAKKCTPPRALGEMITVYDFVTVTCFICIVLTYFMFTEGGMKMLAHFVLPAAAFAIANQVGNAGMNVLAVILIAAGIGYTCIIVRH
jgi:hypothetical protein